MQLLYQGKDIMLSRAELLKMREMTFEDIDPKEIQDVEKLNIDVKRANRRRSGKSWSPERTLIF